MKNLKVCFVIQSLLLVNVVYYLISALQFGFTLNSYSALQVGAMYPLLVTEFDQFWRLITANFVHFDLLHVLMNCYALIQIGVVVEIIFKKKGTLFIVVCSMFSTTMIPLVLYVLGFNSGNVVSGGFSGVVCGLMGALLMYAYINRAIYSNLYNQLLRNLFLILAISMLPSISFLGHLSGMLGGLLSVLIMLQYNKLCKRRSL